MAEDRSGQIVVIFVLQRSGEDAAGYAAAADRMNTLAAAQPGYRGMEHVGDGNGPAVTLSYWADEASAAAWRQHPEHSEVREAGRGRWYDWYALHVAEIGRSYHWTRP
jgi:heme-degrading monooxygenase HmoA